MLRRLAARFVTGPVAFFLAGLIDVGVLLLLAFVASVRARFARGSRAGRPGLRLARRPGPNEEME